MLGFSLAISLLSATLTSAATICNGHAELCGKSFGNVSFVGAHNSYAVGTNNLAVNQDYDITQQLNDGVRMLQMQAHNQSGVIQLCHTSCFLYNGGTLEDYLKKVKSWMDANTQEVLSLLIVNIDNLPAATFGAVFASVGLDKLSYAPTSSPMTASSWPTLGSLIDSGTRLISFLDNTANPAAVPYLIDEFTNIWETAYDVTDPTFDCNVNRTKGDTATQMYLINHFLDKIVLGSPVPDIDRANVTNSASGPGSLGAQVDTCVAANGRAPNFMLVDFYEYGGGSVFQVAAQINGVTYSPTSPIATPITGSSSPRTSTTGNGSSPSLINTSQFAACLLIAVGVALGASSVL
ncbi:PLC-like phosphodiesterase [Mycena indigotica]|uniref:PLC-like phosphodiesterase n=1 Tax=Mycena indigotica TaxID=2126181 RepID=A0A8H6SYS5_9AGAR|nr:PLC-like phosphodiesterase [Mycena indigotica]KAF7307121.1 PLC-like phosphodiesterase [Mycena indigotica]